MAKRAVSSSESSLPCRTLARAAAATAAPTTAPFLGVGRRGCRRYGRRDRLRGGGGAAARGRPPGCRPSASCRRRSRNDRRHLELAVLLLDDPDQPAGPRFGNELAEPVVASVPLIEARVDLLHHLLE